MTDKERKLILRAIQLIHVEDKYFEGLDVLSKMVGGPTVCDKPSEGMDIRELFKQWNKEEVQSIAQKGI